MMVLLRYMAILVASGLLSQVAAHGFGTPRSLDGVECVKKGEGAEGSSSPPCFEESAWYGREASGAEGGLEKYAFRSGKDFHTPDAVCRKNPSKAPASKAITARPGSVLEVQWAWPKADDRHPGAILDYIAKCNGPCDQTDLTELEFIKIAEAGLVDPNANPPKFATEFMNDKDNRRTITIPDLVPGSYLLREEIIALQLAVKVNSSQHFPQCYTLEIQGDGTKEITGGVRAQELYTPTDPGIHYDIAANLKEYPIPGPPIWDGSSPSPSSSTSSQSSSLSSPSSSSASSQSVASPSSTTGRFSTSTTARNRGYASASGKIMTMKVVGTPAAASSGSSATPSSTLGIATNAALVDSAEDGEIQSSSGSDACHVLDITAPDFTYTVVSWSLCPSLKLISMNQLCLFLSLFLSQMFFSPFFHQLLDPVLSFPFEFSSLSHVLPFPK